jgi:hypothetical protein
LRVIKNGMLLATPFVSLTVNASGERGLLGVAFDPGFASNRFVYVSLAKGLKKHGKEVRIGSRSAEKLAQFGADAGLPPLT